MSDQRPGDVRVATLNVWGRHEPWADRRSVLIEGIRDLRPTFDITACERTFDEPRDGVWGSDHFGVGADLAVRTRRS